jgi:hypothetical protein
MGRSPIRTLPAADKEGVGGDSREDLEMAFPAVALREALTLLRGAPSHARNAPDPSSLRVIPDPAPANPPYPASGRQKMPSRMRPSSTR